MKRVFNNDQTEVLGEVVASLREEFREGLDRLRADVTKSAVTDDALIRPTTKPLKED